ncbi:MAG: flippase-like domain-containing protein [Alphaproteobacteria bacterium]|nr:flippase-like domain-containing protein [Alphaproteobacteria bacterium]
MNGLAGPAGWRKLPLRLLVVALATVFLIFLSWGMPWGEVGLALMTASPLWLGVAVVSNLMIYPPWTLQWQLLASSTTRVPTRRMLGIVAISSMGTAAMSSLVGAASAIVLLVGRGGMTTVSAASLIAMDQILVGLAKLTVLAVALQIAAVPEVASQGSLPLAVLTFGGLGALYATAVLKPSLSFSEADSQLRRWVAVNLDRISGSLEVMRRPGLALSTYALAVLKRMTEIGAAFAITAACGEPSIPLAFLVVAAVSITTAVPLVPGSLGVYSATVFMVYEFMGYPAHVALAAGILQHLVELVPAVAVGYLTIIVTRLSERPDEA